MTTPVRPSNPYLDENLGADRQLRASLFTASTRPEPAAWAKTVQAAQRVGLPPSVVQGQEARIAEARPPIEVTALRAQAPGLAQWLEDPDRATLARHELAPLSAVDQAARALAPMSTARRAIETGWNDYASAVAQLAIVFGVRTPEEMIPTIAAHNRQAAALRAGMPAYAQAYEAARAQADTEQAATLATPKGARARAMLAALNQPNAPIGGILRTLGDLVDAGGLMLQHKRGVGYQVLESLPGMAAAMVPGVASGGAGAAFGSVVPGVGSAAGGIIGFSQGTFAGMLPGSIGGEMTAELQRRGVDVTDEGALRRAFADPALMASIREQALRKGLTVAAVNAALTPLAGRFAGAARAAEGATAVRIAGGVAKDLAVQSAGQVTGDVAGQVVSGEPLDVGRALQSGLEALPMALVMEAGSAVLHRSERAHYAPDPAVALEDAHARTVQALAAERDVATLDAAVQAVREAPVTASVPDAIASLVATSTGEGTGDGAAAVFIDPKDWDRVWLAREQGPATVAAALMGDGGAAYDRARATGTPLAVPLGTYVAAAAETPEPYAALRDAVRLAPDGLSLTEARAHLASMPATAGELLRELQAPPAAAAEGAAPAPPAPATLPVADAAVREALDATPAPPRLFDNPRALGLSEATAARYEQAIAQAHEEAVARLTEARTQALAREQSSAWRDLRGPVEADVTREVQADPTYRALALLQQGEGTDGTPLPEGVAFKLDRAAVKELLGPDAVQRLPRGITAAGGEHPDIVAEDLGFPSGRALLTALAHAPAPETIIARLTDERMRDLYGEPPTVASLREQARVAVLSGAQDAVWREELRVLGERRPGMRADVTAAIAREPRHLTDLEATAARAVETTPVRDLRPRLAEAAAQRAGVEARAADRRGDFARAIAAKEAQRQQAATFRATVAAKEEIAGALEQFRALWRPDAVLAELRDMDLVNAGRAILAEYGLGRRTGHATDYLKQMQRYDPETYAVVAPLVAEGLAVAPAGTHWEALTVAQFRDVRDAVDALWTLARREKQILVDGQLRERAEVKAALVARLQALAGPPERAGYQQAATLWDKTRGALVGWRAAMRRVEHWVHAMDNGAPDGVFRRYVWNGVSEAATRYRLAKREALTTYRALVAELAPAMRREKIPAPELGYTFNGTAEVLGAMLHTGNDSNLRKLLLGGRGENRPWGQLREDGTLDATRWQAFVERMQREGILTKVHYDYLQGVWNLFESYKAGAQQAHKQVYGHYFGEITRRSFRTPWGEYEGGYVPARQDPDLVPNQQRYADTESLLGLDTGLQAMPSTGKGSTLARNRAFAAALDINVSRMIPSHLDWVTRFTHLQPVLVDVARLLRSRDLIAHLDTVDPEVRDSMLLPWLQRSAQQRVEQPHKGRGGRFLDTAARYVRTTTALQVLTLNIPNALQNLTGLSPALLAVKPTALGAALVDYLKAPRQYAEAVAEKSPYMRARSAAETLGVQQAIDRVLLDPGIVRRSADWLATHSHILSGMTQNLVDLTVWGAAWNEAVQAGHGDAEAVRIADSAVRRTQGAGRPEDIAASEAGSPQMKLVTMFSGYFNNKANFAASELVVAARTLNGRQRVGRMLLVGTLAYVTAAALGTAILKAVRHEPLDADDDGIADDLAALFLGAPFAELWSAVPLGGAVERFIERRAGKRGYSAHLSISPAVDALERAGAGLVEAAKVPFGDQVTRRDARDFLTLIGVSTGLPTGAVTRTRDLVERWRQ